MPMIEIADITITRRMVEIPDHCPKCGADFTEDQALRHYQIFDGTTYGYLVEHHDAMPGEDTVTIDGDLDDFPEALATNIVECMHCDEQDDVAWTLAGEYVDQSIAPEVAAP